MEPIIRPHTHTHTLYHYHLIFLDLFNYTGRCAFEKWPPISIESSECEPCVHGVSSSLEICSLFLSVCLYISICNIFPIFKIERQREHIHSTLFYIKFIIVKKWLCHANAIQTEAHTYIHLHMHRRLKVVRTILKIRMQKKKNNKNERRRKSAQFSYAQRKIR